MSPMRTEIPIFPGAATWIRRTAGIGAVTILALAVSASPADPTKAGAKEAKAAKGDIVSVFQIDKGEVFVRRPLEHKIFSSDRRLFAGYYRDGWDEIISVHDSASGKQIRKIVGHGDEVRAFKFTPDGKILASRCVNRNREGWALWEVATGELLMRLPTITITTAPKDD
jgi:WD40 repeat protein